MLGDRRLRGHRSQLKRVARLVGCRHTRPSGPRPLEEGSELAGFVVADVTPQRRLSLAGSHHFSTYRLVLGVRPDGPGRSVISAATRAEFPGAKGRLYRAAVIGTRGHVLVVNRMLAAIEQRSLRTGARSFTFAQDSRTALSFAAGERKVNLHEVGREHLPNARAAGPGTADLCFLVDEPIDVVAARLQEQGVEVEHGPDRADGARGDLRSVWLRDPDGNLVELAQSVS